MLDFEKYKVKEDIRKEPECPKLPKVPKDKDPELYRIYADQLEEWRKKKTIWNNYWKEISDANRKLEVQFHDDLLEDLGIKNNPKAEKLYQIAWAMGHAYGYHDVYSKASDLVELIE